ncbi:MAG: META domain-containing protein [Rikenellaceae bacterium]
MRKLFILPLMAMLIFAITSCCGCRGAKSNNPYSLTSSQWQLVEMQGKKIEAVDNNYTINFDNKENRSYGQGDCNNYFFSYSEESVRKLKFEDGGSTRMFCPNQSQEDTYIQLFKNIDSYTVDGDMLMLQEKGEVVMIFVAKGSRVDSGE